MSDKFDEQAEKIIAPLYRHWFGFEEDRKLILIESFAAALRDQGKQIADLKALADKLWAALTPQARHRFNLEELEKKP